MKNNLYCIALHQEQTTCVSVVAPSEEAAKIRLKTWLESKDGIVYPDEMDDLYWDKGAEIGMIECLEDDTNEKDGLDV